MRKAIIIVIKAVATSELQMKMTRQLICFSWYVLSAILCRYWKIFAKHRVLAKFSISISYQSLGLTNFKVEINRETDQSYQDLRLLESFKTGRYFQEVKFPQLLKYFVLLGKSTHEHHLHTYIHDTTIPISITKSNVCLWEGGKIRVKGWWYPRQRKHIVCYSVI